MTNISSFIIYGGKHLAMQWYTVIIIENILRFYGITHQNHSDDSKTDINHFYLEITPLLSVKIKKMKLLFTILFFSALLLSSSNQDELQAVEATFDGQAGGVFYFVDMEGSSYVFEDIDPEAQEKYDLTDGSCEGERFTVVYRIVYTTSEDKEDEDDYGECIIVDLERVG